jgi:hypothetical protein
MRPAKSAAITSILAYSIIFAPSADARWMLDALVTDGVTKYENHKIYMILKYSNGEQGVGYQYIGSNREQAISQIDATQDRIEILSDSYNIEWSDEVIDESSHYKTTTTTTTTYFAWN